MKIVVLFGSANVVMVFAPKKKMNHGNGVTKWRNFWPGKNFMGTFSSN